MMAPGLAWAFLPLILTTGCAVFPGGAPSTVSVPVTSDPPGAVVELDGERVGTTPCTVTLGSARTCRGAILVRLGTRAVVFHVKREATTRTGWWGLLWTRDRYVSWDRTPVHVDIRTRPQ